MIGQGVICRGYIESLLAAGARIRTTDIDPGNNRGHRDLRYDSLARTNFHGCSRRLGVLVTGAVGMPPNWRGEYWRRRLGVSTMALNVWRELDTLPPEALEALASFDALLASTHFIAEVMQRHLPRTPVLYCPFPLQVPDVAPMARDRFALPPDAVLVLIAFDPASDVERKNPFAAVEAFRRAAERDPKLHLLVKINNPRQGHDPFAGMTARMQAAVADHSRIRLLDETLSEADNLALLKAADIYLSLHRAEGLGLGMLESMHLGRAVVATGYSGNLSFMDEKSACLVPFKKIPAGGQNTPAPAAPPGGPTWAEPEVDAAAGWLVELARNPGLRASLGEAAVAAARRYSAEAERLEAFVALSRLTPVWQLRDDLQRATRRVLKRLRLVHD